MESLESYGIEKAYILGAGPFAQELKIYLAKKLPWAQVIMVSNSDEKNAISLNRYRDKVNISSNTSVTYLGSGKTFIKARMMSEVEGVIGPPVILHADVWSDDIGIGTIIADGAVIAPMSIIGENVLVNYGATVGYRSQVGNLCVVCPQAAVGGFCEINEGVYIGSGAMIREGLILGKNSTIGMGAIVTKNVPPNSVVTGINEVRPQPDDRRW